jgi:hypothetical protein
MATTIRTTPTTAPPSPMSCTPVYELHGPGSGGSHWWSLPRQPRPDDARPCERVGASPRDGARKDAFGRRPAVLLGPSLLSQVVSVPGR